MAKGKFGIVFRGYNTDEVDAFIDRLLNATEQRFTEQYNRIIELRMIIDRQETEIDRLKVKERSIGDAIVAAQEKALDMETSARLRYKLEIERLQSFRSRIDSYFRDAVKKKSLEEGCNEMLTAIDNIENEMTKVFDELNIFDAEEKEPQSISSGFDIEEALNPKETLDEICQSLGIMKTSKV